MNTERESFESWATNPDQHGNFQIERDSEFGMYGSRTQTAFGIWQASRRVALGDAASICTSIAIAPSNVVLGVAVECATKIRNLL